jgi:hypothetical protein
MEQEYFTKFVYGVYNDLGEPEDYTIAKISAWFLDNANVGKLNNLIGTQISGVAYKDSHGVVTGYDLVPNPSNDQLAIYKMIFDCNYYKQQSKNLARSAGTIGSDWTTLREGDSNITKINKNEISKNFRGLAQDCQAELNKTVKMYLKYGAVPEQIVGDDTEGVSHYIIQEYQRTLN